MQCPIDKTNLVMSERSGIEIDYCPQCRGIWLDRGELDKIIERSEQAQPASPQPQQPYQGPNYPQQSGKHDGQHGGNYNQNNGYPSKRRESFLGDLFG